MRELKICLWICGIFCLLPVVGVFSPVSAIESFCTWMGVDSFPDSALLLYALRVCSAMAAGIGIFFVILALSPADYGIMVPFSGIGALALGVVCGIVGIRVNMPLLWFLGDALGCLVMGVLILVFWRQSRQG